MNDMDAMSREETPGMEAKAHSKKFLKKAESMVKGKKEKKGKAEKKGMKR